MSEPKKYKLNNEETRNIKFRRTVMDYMTQAVHDELGQYLYSQILPRLKLKDVKVEISEDGEWITEIVEKKSNIILPNK